MITAPSGPRASQRRRVAHRRLLVAQFYLSGAYSLKELQERLAEVGINVTIGLLSNDVRTLEKRWTDRALTTTGDTLKRELVKLDTLEATMLAALADKECDRQDLVDKMLKIAERRAKLLGLDAAIRVDLGNQGNKPFQVNFTALTDAELDKIARGVTAERVEDAPVLELAAGAIMAAQVEGQNQADPPPSSPEGGS